MAYFYLIIILLARISFSQHTEILTLSQAIEIGLNNSYNIKQAKSQLIQSQHSFKAWKLSYSTYANIIAETPKLTKRFSESLDPASGRVLIVRQDNISYRSALNINQPILFSDGTLSLNGSLYNIQQQNNINYQADVTLKYNQPLFQISLRKINLKKAEYSLEKSKILFFKQKRDLSYFITEQYLYLLRSKRNLMIAQESFNRSREIYKLAK